MEQHLSRAGGKIWGSVALRVRAGFQPSLETWMILQVHLDTDMETM